MSAESFSSEEINEISDKLEAAIAISVREVQDIQVAQKISAVILAQLGASSPENAYKPMTQDEEMAMVTQRTSINVAYMSGEVVPMEDKIHAKSDEDKAKKAALSRELLNASGKDDAYYAKIFTERYVIAQAIAEELNIPLSHVFAGDDTYYELYRRAQSPEEYAQDIADVASNITGEVMHAAQARHIERFISPDQLQELTPEQLAEASISFQLNSEYLELINKVAEVQAEIFRQTTIYQFLKIYGMDALLNLDYKLRDAIAPKQPWVREVFAEYLD